MKRTVYDTSYVKTITAGTKENMQNVKALSEHYVIRNAKRANKLIENMRLFVGRLRGLIKFFIREF